MGVRSAARSAVATTGKLFFLAWLLAPSTATAHATLNASAPDDGAVLAHAPALVQLQFNEAVEPVMVRLVGPGGLAQSLSLPAEPRQQLDVALPDGLPTGSYALTWRVISADAHPVTGTLTFSIGQRGTQPATAATSLNDSWRITAIVIRWMGDMATLFAMGGALFFSLVWKTGRLARPVRGVMTTAIALAALSSIVAIAISGAWILDAPPSAILGSEVWRYGWHTNTAMRTGAGIVGLILTGVALYTRPLAGRTALAVAGACMVAVGFALSGHAASAAAAWLARAALVAHVFTLAFWLGALWPLDRALRSLPIGEARALVRRFSAIGIPAVAIALIAGVALSLTRISTFAALIETYYGRLLSLKLLFVLAILGVALWNRQRLLPRLDTGTAKSLQRNIRIEAALATAILLLTAVLSHTPPQASVIHDAQGQISITAAKNDYRLTLTLTPGHTGPNQLTLHLTDAAGQPIEKREVTIELSHTDAGIAHLRRKLTPQASGIYTLDRIDLPVSGKWIAGIEILISDFEMSRMETSFGLQ